MRTHALRLFLACVCIAGIAAGLPGCATSSGAGYFNKMTVRRTPLYLEGPHQLTPPNAQLEPGTRLRIVEVQGDFCRVELIGGMKGFVHSDDIGPLREHTGWTQ